MSVVGVSVYEQDIHGLSSVGAMDTTPISPESLLSAYPDIPASFQTTLMTNNTTLYLVKSEQADDAAAAMQLMVDDASMMYMNLPMEAIDSANGLEQIPVAYALSQSDGSMSLELSASALSTPSPPGASLLNSSIQAPSPPYSVATSSLEAALTPKVPLTSPSRSANSISPISGPSSFTSSSTSPPPDLGLPPAECSKLVLNEEVPMGKQKKEVAHFLDALARDIVATKHALQLLETEDDLPNELKSRMNAISRMAAQLSISEDPAPVAPAVSAPIFDSSMAGPRDNIGGYPLSIANPTFDTSTHLPVSDQSRKRGPCEMDEPRTVKAMKREPQDELPLVLPNIDSLPLNPLAPFPAMSAIPLSSMPVNGSVLPQSRPSSRPPTPSLFAQASQQFTPLSVASYPLPPVTAPIGLGAPMQSAQIPLIPASTSFSSVRPWPESSVTPTRHHHSLSAGSAMTPIMGMPPLQMPPPVSIHPGLASGPTTPITVNPPPIGRPSRSGSLNNLSFDAPFSFFQEKQCELVPRPTANPRNGRTSINSSNWYFGNDMSSPTNTSDEPNTARNTPSDDEDEDSSSDSDDNEYRTAGTSSTHLPFVDAPSSTSSSSSDIPQEYRAEVDRIFFEYLNKICSNLDAKDSKGDHIHQTLMAKKMQRLDESPDFRPFKFRIQAFTTAFLEELAYQGYPEDKIPMKKIRNYLWHQPHILRFNEDGKKAKSKGNHIWNVEARKLGDNKWEFRPFYRKLAGNPPSVAYAGLPWSWTVRVWDPQASFSNVPVQYSSPNLPSWLSWQDDVLSGIPPQDAEPCTVTVIAKYVFDGVEGQLTRTFTISTTSMADPSGYPRSRRASLVGEPPRRSTSDSALFQAPQRSKTRNGPPVSIPVPGESSSTRVIRVLQNVAQRVTEEAESQFVSSPSPPKTEQLQEMVKSKHVLDQTVEAMDMQMAGHAPMETKRLAIAAQQVVIQAAANVIADRNVSIGRAPTVPNKSTAVQRVSVGELSDATHDAIVQAVQTNGPASTEVDIIVTAASILKAKAPVAEPHPFASQSLPPLPEYT